MYGKQLDHVGAGHGFAGNVFPVLRGARWLEPGLVERFEARTLATLDIAATHEDDAASWQPVFDPAVHGFPERPMMQDCHGAPGIVCRLADARSPALRALLVKGGETVWLAGPLARPPACATAPTATATRS